MFSPHPDDQTFTATPAEAHAEWHLNSGVPMGFPGCPQDACHPAESYGPEDEPWTTTTVRCGHCKGRHSTIYGVWACSRRHHTIQEA